MSTDLSTSVEVKRRIGPAPGEPSVRPAPSRAEVRLISLDTFRGFIMFWIIGGEAFLVALRSLGQNPAINVLAYEVNHTPWQGLRFYDCIWPSFMLMVGVSIPLSFAKRSLTETDHQIRMHALRRALVLF